jgi:hypothetical protein
LDRATIRFRVFGHAATCTGSFCVFGPVLSSPAHGSPYLAMEPTLHRIATVFNGQNHFKKRAGSKVLDEYYNTYLRK